MNSYSLIADRVHTLTDVDGGVGATGLLERWYINVADRKILSVAPKPEFNNIIDYADKYEILPAMINAHSHLELSQLESPIKLSESNLPNSNSLNFATKNSNKKYRFDFDSWIQKVIQFRRSSVYDSSLAILAAKQYFAANVGTAAVVDIVPFDLDTSQFDIGENISWLCYPELIAWDSISVTKKIELICSLPRSSYSGLSPHAVYTVSGELVEFVANFGVGVAMHLAESPDEMQLLKTRGGRLAEMMRRVDENYDPSKILLGSRAIDYLKVLSCAPRVLVIHGNYLDEEEMRFLAKHRETMAVVYTPRSHDYFGFDEFPLQKMLDFGVCVFLGTDSKASSPDLNLTNEINHAASIYRNIPLETFFQMTTIQPAKFLGLTQNYGTIESGKNAIFTLFSKK
jgi:cytosine/adenosine deaminase-related metal-dependent hydrolase